MPVFFDLLVFLAIVISAMFSTMRGATREFLSVVPWGLAIFGSLLWYESDSFEGLRTLTESFLVPFFDEQLSRIIGSLILFIVILITTSILIKKFLVILLLSVHIGAIDRFLGFIFGTLRGIVVVMFLVLAFDGIVGYDLPFFVQQSYSYDLLLQNSKELTSFIAGVFVDEPFGDYNIETDIPAEVIDEEIIENTDQF